MKTEQKLQILKEEYLGVKPSVSLEKYGWQMLENQIAPVNNLSITKKLYRPLPAIFLALFLLISSFGIVRASKKTLPGDVLYPVKRLTEDFTSITSGDKGLKIKKRAEEVLQSVEEKRGRETVQETVKNYQDEVLKTKKEVEKSGKSNELRQELERHEQKFNSVLHQETVPDQELQKAIEASRNGREENDKDSGKKDSDGQNKGGENQDSHKNSREDKSE